jgi:phenylpropionate dioxygenase-like ring-hydroxylating dioxygenase large terminal subunit
VETSETLPPAVYRSQAFYDLEVEKIFKKEWFAVGHVSQIPNVGDYFTLEILGEPLIVVRGADRIRVISSVCLHRWAPVAEGKGNAKIFSCPFHKWGYALDGQLLGAPFMEQAAGFDPKACRLPEFRSEIVEDLGLIFITFSETAGSISEKLEELCVRLKNWHMKDLVAVRPREQKADFNWKIQLETGMECYHHFGAHPTTFEVNYPTKLTWMEPRRAGWGVCHSPAWPELTEEELTMGFPVLPDLVGEERRAFDLYHIYPLTRMSARGDRMNFNQLVPMGPHATRSFGFTLLPPEIAALTELVEEKFEAQRWFSETANKEDTAVNLMQMVGAGSAYAVPGRLSHLEETVWQLADYVRERLSAN